jgi:DTW domain-containing protein YfiP
MMFSRLNLYSCIPWAVLVASMTCLSSYSLGLPSSSSTRSSSSSTASGKLVSSIESPLPSHLKTKIASSVAKCERREEERNTVARSRCDRCNKPLRTCICSSLPPKLISTSTQVLILQHPREFRKSSLSTVPLISLVLEKCTIKVGYTFSILDLHLVQDCLHRGIQPLLLFPGPSAVSLDDCSNHDSEQTHLLQNIKSNNQLLILIDGTWSQAKNIIKQSPELMNCCQQIQFQSENDSIYDIVRKEPQKHCISTLEACAQALLFLEPNQDVANEAKQYLERSMKMMVHTKKRMKDEEDSKPRFLERNTKMYEMNKRRNQIKKKLFQE